MHIVNRSVIFWWFIRRRFQLKLELFFDAINYCTMVQWAKIRAVGIVPSTWATFQMTSGSRISGISCKTLGESMTLISNTRPMEWHMPLLNFDRQGMLPKLFIDVMGTTSRANLWGWKSKMDLKGKEKEKKERDINQKWIETETTWKSLVCPSQVFQMVPCGHSSKIIWDRLVMWYTVTSTIMARLKWDSVAMMGPNEL